MLRSVIHVVMYGWINDLLPSPVCLAAHDLLFFDTDELHRTNYIRFIISVVYLINT